MRFCNFGPNWDQSLLINPPTTKEYPPLIDYQTKFLSPTKCQFPCLNPIKLHF